MAIRYKTTDFYTSPNRPSGYTEKDNDFVEKKCAYCNEKFKRFSGEVHYLVGKKEFCKWNCKCAYLREKEEEENKRIREEFYKDKATTLGQIIYNKRKQQKLKKHDVYNNAKVNHTSYSQIENDDFARIKEETVLKVLEYLDIPFTVYFPYLKKIYKKED